jgi:multiple sugar transport system permease protein
VIWNWMLDTNGLINSLALRLDFVTSAVPFLTHRWLIIFSAISLTVWKGLGYYMVIYLAALTNVSKDLHEAAAVDGAGTFQRFRSVTIPGVRVTMGLVAVLVAVSAFRVFSELYILTNGTGGPGGQASSIVMLIQGSGTGTSGRLGYASALSVIMFVITIIPMLALVRLNRKASS